MKERDRCLWNWGRQSYDNYLKEDNWKNVCDEALRIANVNLESKPAPAGEMKVVLGQDGQQF